LESRTAIAVFNKRTKQANYNMDPARQKNLVSIAQVSLFAIFTTYSFFFAKNIDSIGDSVLLGMSLICLVTLSIVKPDFSFLTSSFRYLSVFFFLCMMSIILPIWPKTDIYWAHSAIYKCILGLFVVLIFKAQNSINKIQEIWIVFIALCLLMILQNTGFNIKEILNLSFLECALGEWNEKHHTFWLVLFFWPILYSIKDLFNSKKLITILFFFLALFSSYSESAKLAILVSSIVFIFSKLEPTKTWKITYSFILVYILLFPLVFQIISFTEMEFLYNRIYDRFAFFETASNVIVDNPFLGSGFGSSKSMEISPYIPSNVEISRIGVESLDGKINFAGGHPHNFVALIWIEFGLIGALMLTFFIYRFNNFIHNIIKQSDAAPYIFSIITTALVLFSCSWSIWQTDVVLTYLMFLACLSFLITAGSCNKNNLFHAIE